MQKEICAVQEESEVVIISFHFSVEVGKQHLVDLVVIVVSNDENSLHFVNHSQRTTEMW